MSTETKVMSPEAQRIAIAGACGWTNVRVATILKGRVLKAGIWGNPPSWNAGGYTVGELIPDYLNSLDAMHEAQRSLTEPQLMLMHNWLQEICERAGKFPGGVDMRLATRIWCAESHQRSEAFLRTLNLWTDQPPTP